jgi:hypothetical protein
VFPSPALGFDACSARMFAAAGLNPARTATSSAACEAAVSEFGDSAISGTAAAASGTAAPLKRSSLEAPGASGLSRRPPSSQLPRA